MHKVFCLSLLICSPMFAAQQFIKALVSRQSIKPSVTFAQRRCVSGSASCTVDGRMEGSDRVCFDDKMKSILARMQQAGLDIDGWGISKYDIVRAFGRYPLPLIEAFYSLRKIANEMDTFKDNLPEDRRLQKHYFAAKDRIDEALVSLKQDKRWAVEYETYLRGVKDGTVEPLGVYVDYASRKILIY